MLLIFTVRCSSVRVLFLIYRQLNHRRLTHRSTTTVALFWLVLTASRLALRYKAQHNCYKNATKQIVKVFWHVRKLG